jgi:hypothetical protein
VRYRIYVEIPEQKNPEKTVRYYLQTGYPLPKRTLLASSFIWVSSLANPTQFTDKETMIKWFSLLAKRQELWSVLAIETVKGS